jgi:hypothetical protein
MNAEEARRTAQVVVSTEMWRWMPGMLTLNGLRVVRVEPDGYVTGYSTVMGHTWDIGKNELPDLRDPATLGCLATLWGY